MGFVRSLAKVGTFGLAGLALSDHKKKKPTPSLMSTATNSEGTTTPSLISKPTIY